MAQGPIIEQQLFATLLLLAAPASSRFGYVLLAALRLLAFALNITLRVIGRPIITGEEKQAQRPIIIRRVYGYNLWAIWTIGNLGIDT